VFVLLRQASVGRSRISDRNSTRRANHTGTACRAWGLPDRLDRVVTLWPLSDCQPYLKSRIRGVRVTKNSSPLSTCNLLLAQQQRARVTRTGF